MRKYISVLIFLVVCIMSFAQDKMFVHKTDKSVIGILISEIEELFFSANETLLNISMVDRSVSDIPVSEIDSITFGSAVPVSDIIEIAFTGNSAAIVNPYANFGVSVTQSGGDVIINSTVTDAELQYHIWGTTTDGSLKIYSDYKFS